MIETRLTVCVRELAAWLYKRELYQNFSNEEKVEVSRTCLTQARRMLAADALYDALLWTHRIAAGEDEVKRPSFDDLLDIRKIASDALALADGKEA